QEAGRAFVRDQLYPALMALRPHDVDPGDHAATAWRLLLDSLAVEAPADRLHTLRQVHAANRLASLQAEAVQLAVSRYVATHDVDPPSELADELVGLDVPAIRARAEAALAELEALRVIAEADAGFDVHRLQGTTFEIPTIRAVLQRAISGEFSAAEG